MRVSILFLICAALSGCTLPPSPQAVFICNPTLSNAHGFDSGEERKAVKRLINAHPQSSLIVLTTTSYPLEIEEPMCRGLGVDTVFEHLNEARMEQSRAEQPDERCLDLIEAGRAPPDYNFRYGTNHAHPFQKVMDLVEPGIPVTILLSTDGFNEEYDWDEVRSTLKQLFERHKVRLIIIGVSQQVVDENGTCTVLDLWRESLTATGVQNLSNSQTQGSGYFLSSRLSVPSEILRRPWQLEERNELQ